MNSFRSAILSGKGLHSGDPVVREKEGRGSTEDDLSSVEVPRSEARTHNHRDDDRHRLEQESATARFDGEEYDVDLINLSGGGAMIRADFQPRLWERVDLILAEGGEIECAVRWLREHGLDAWTLASHWEGEADESDATAADDADADGAPMPEAEP